MAAALALRPCLEAELSEDFNFARYAPAPILPAPGEYTPWQTAVICFRFGVALLWLHWRFRAHLAMLKIWAYATSWVCSIELTRIWGAFGWAYAIILTALWIWR
jgi:hypothetical protein